jgi:catechol 2,3-dioxygenase-like lactoylglutathione lyase family enzyme
MARRSALGFDLEMVLVSAFGVSLLVTPIAYAQDAATKPGVQKMTQTAGHITGIGGVFFKSPDPKALSAWYRDVLGMPLESWGGAALKLDAPGHPPVIVWSPFKDTSDYMAPSTREFMVNLAVDNLDALLVKLTAKNVPILKRDDTDPSGKFAWIVDPDGTKIELWEPKPKP